jgi:hypothetical protein
MNTTIPSGTDVSAALAKLNRAQLERLAELSSVSYYTLLKVQKGVTKNPGIDTARRFMPHVKAAAKG